jgi:hypothetical protein
MDQEQGTRRQFLAATGAVSLAAWGVPLPRGGVPVAPAYATKVLAKNRSPIGGWGKTRPTRTVPFQPLTPSGLTSQHPFYELVHYICYARDYLLSRPIIPRSILDSNYRGSSLLEKGTFKSRMANKSAQ